MTSINIAATVDRVWSVLTVEMRRDPKPFGILRIEGALALNARLKLWSETDPKRAFALRVTAFDAPQLMVWRGRMPFGLFQGTRTFQLSPQGATTNFEMQENFTGPLSGLIAKSIPDLTPSFEKFANTLKEKAEHHE